MGVDRRVYEWPVTRQSNLFSISRRTTLSFSSLLHCFFSEYAHQFTLPFGDYHYQLNVIYVIHSAFGQCSFFLALGRMDDAPRNRYWSHMFHMGTGTRTFFICLVLYFITEWIWSSRFSDLCCILPVVRPFLPLH